jgi:Flp pilus assembly pilin Flp
MLKNLWNDDAGIVALEYMLVATIIGLSLTLGLHAVSTSLNVELTELGNAIQTISQAYNYCGQTGCCSSVAGSAATDTAGSEPYGSVTVTPNDVSRTCSGTP